VAINQDTDRLPEAIADNFASGIVTLGTPYTDSEVLINVTDAPIGYDWGPGGYKHVQGSRAAALITVGSDASYTVLGYFVDQESKGISLLQGTATLGDTVYSIFTNKVGRFVIEGARPGIYDIHLGPFKGSVNIESPDSNLVQVGKIILEQS
jgi:outer membrane usher protein